MEKQVITNTIWNIHGAPVHSNISHSIAYEIYKRQILQHWENWNLTNTADWDKIDLTSFKQARETTDVHTAHFILKYTSNNFPTMAVLKWRGNAITNIWPHCGVAPKMIQHIYQCTHKGSGGIRTASVDALWKWLEDWNTDPDIANILSEKLLCIAGLRNELK